MLTHNINLTMKKISMKHSFTQRIIYQDTDAEGVVYYANYLGFFERGRMELLRQRGIALTEMKEKNDILFAINKVECDYLAPAKLEDKITITTEIIETGKVRIVFKQEALLDEKVLVSAKITACSLSAKDFRPVRLPTALAK